MKKFLILLFILLLSSCGNKENITTNPTISITPPEPTQRVDDPVTEIYNPFVKKEVNYDNYLDQMNLSMLIDFESLFSIYVGGTNLVNNIDVESIISKHQDVQMIKYSKFNDNNYDNKYRFAIKDIRKNIRIEAKNTCVDSYYIGESGYIYYFLDDFYYVSKESIYVETFGIKNYLKLSDIVKGNNITIKQGDLNISVDDGTSLFNMLKDVNLIINKDMYLYGLNIEEYVNAKCSDGIIVCIDDFKINISKTGQIYIIDEYLYTSTFVDEKNYYDIIINNTNNSFRTEENLPTEAFLNEIINFNNIDEYKIYPKNGYSTSNKKEDINILSSLFNDVKMIKKDNENYYYVLNDIKEEIKINLYSDEYCYDKLYVGLSGHIYYFFNNCYYVSYDSIYYNSLIENVNYIYTDIKSYNKVMSSIKTDIVKANIIDAESNEIINEIPSEILKDFINYFGDTELFFIGTVLDGYSSVEEFTDEVMMIKEKVKTGYIIEFIYENTKRIYLNISMDGNVYHTASTTYVNSYNNINYYNLITNYINS